MSIAAQGVRGVWVRRSGLSVLVAAIWAALAFASYHGWVHGVDHRDFYPRWAGARLAVYEHRDLYSAETTRAMQLMLYGRERGPGEDPQAFAYPAVIVPLLLPFWWIGDVEVATALWQSTSILLLVASLLAVRRAIPPPSFPVSWIAAALFTPYVILMIFNAQITALPFAALAFAYAGLQGRRGMSVEWLGGAALAAGFIKPELMIVPAALLSLLALRERRWAFLGGLAAAGAALFGASLLLAGWWVPDWLAALDRYAVYAQVSFAPQTLFSLSPVALVIGIALVVLVVRTLRFDAFSLTAGGTALGMLILPQTLIWGLTMISLPLAMGFRGRARPLAALIWLAAWLLEVAAILLMSAVPDIWRWQNALLPLIVLIPVAVASRIKLDAG